MVVEMFFIGNQCLNVYFCISVFHFYTFSIFFQNHYVFMITCRSKSDEERYGPLFAVT